MDLVLNSKLDRSGLAEQFAAKPRIRIDHLLRPDSADQIYQCLRNEIPWNLAFIDQGEVKSLPDDEAARLPPAEQAATMRRIYQRANREFQFLYNTYNLDDDNEVDLPLDSDFHQIVAFLRSPPVIDFVATVSGVEGINKVTAQASRYKPGHFLLNHDDSAGSTTRRLAFVINVSKGWAPGWGGLLQFHDRKNNIEEAFLPAYNSMSLFAVPMAHSVSGVMPFATEPRLAVSGWFQVES